MAMPQVTLEIRWFFPETVSAAGVQDWFLHNPRLGPALTEEQGETRVDLYLLTPGNTQIGPKLRGGRFEIKVRQNHQEIIDLNGSVSGKAEIWHKWKWPYARAKKDKEINDLVISSFLARTSENLRATVWKKRWQRKFKADHPEELTPVPMGQKGLSCWISAEFTGIKIKGTPWWTLALEIYGTSEEPFTFLRECLHWFLRDYAGPSLTVANSYSYPEWLALL